jgi:hypothetical protein
MGKFRKVPPEVPISDLGPLNISCGSTKCEEGLHCFRMTKSQIKKWGSTGVCKECGAHLIEWDRIQKQDSRDAKFIFDSLKNELIRHVFWHIPIKSKDVQNAMEKGAESVIDEARRRMTEKIGIMNPYRHGITPYTGNVIYYAQHATATCCRRCMEYWYGIPAKNRILTPDEINFSTDLVRLYLEERIPDLFKK